MFFDRFCGISKDLMNAVDVIQKVCKKGVNKLVFFIFKSLGRQ